MTPSFDKQVIGAIFGFVTADALGVPVEFKSRALLDLDPVTDMREYGTYHQPKGTWSDDSSMTLCTLEALIDGLDYDAMMKRFQLWLDEGYMTAHDELFDVGVTTREAMMRYCRGVPSLQCGGNQFHENGNGALMRILPIALYLYRTMGDKFSSKPAAYEIIHNVSSLTHAHPISQIACGIYCAIACELLNGAALYDGIKKGINTAKKYYRSKIEFAQDLKLYLRVDADKLLKCERSTIRSTGYVLYSLEAALWCLLTTDNLKDCLLKAVNLGDDTDTVAAIAGGLAGLAYGKDAIPSDWLEVIPKKDLIFYLCEDFCEAKI